MNFFHKTLHFSHKQEPGVPLVLRVALWLNSFGKGVCLPGGCRDKAPLIRDG